MASKGEAMPVEEAAAVVKDGRRLAVHQAPGAHDAPAEGLPDGLVPQAHAEDRQLAAESAAGASSEMPASLGVQGRER